MLLPTLEDSELVLSELVLLLLSASVRPSRTLKVRRYLRMSCLQVLLASVKASLWLSRVRLSHSLERRNADTLDTATYIDVCSICEGGVTTMTTTITTLHCGCTDTPMPTIPMTTMTKACGCGEGGAASSLIVTSPDTSAIASAAGSMPTITAPVLPTEPVASSGNGPAVAAAPGVGSVSGPLYSNGTAFTNGTAGIVAVASGAASGASAPAAGSGVGATLAQALNVPSMTNFVAASGAGIGGLTTVNASMTSVETVGLESIMPANGNVRSVVANIGTVLFVVIVALCIDITVVA